MLVTNLQIDDQKHYIYTNVEGHFSKLFLKENFSQESK